MTGRFLKLIAGIMVLSLIAGCSKSANNSKGNVEIQINTVGGLNTAAVDATSLIKTAPSVSTGILKNPGKGWFIYGDGENNLTPFSSQPLAWQYASVGYCRYDWAVLEPEEGRYDWSYIDSAIEFCRNNGVLTQQARTNTLPRNGCSTRERSATAATFTTRLSIRRRRRFSMCPNFRTTYI